MTRIFKRPRSCDGCGVELLRIGDGKETVCANLSCPCCPIPVGPSPAAVRDGELRAAGYMPADHRSSFPPPPRPAPPPPAPPPQASKALDAETRAWLARGFILQLEAEIERDARQAPRDRLDALSALNAEADALARRLRPRDSR